MRAEKLLINRKLGENGLLGNSVSGGVLVEVNSDARRSLFNLGFTLDFNRAVGKRYRYGYSAIQILLSVGIVGVVEKVGRKTYYGII